MGDSRLAELARRHGVATAYEDVWGERHEASDATLRAVLAAMHVDATGAAQIEAAIAGHEYARRAQTLPAAPVRCTPDAEASSDDRTDEWSVDDDRVAAVPPSWRTEAWPPP